MKHTVTFFNLGGLLLAILGVNLNTNPALDQLVQEKYLAKPQLNEYTYEAEFNEKDYAKSLENLGITLHPGTDFTPESKDSPSSLNHCKSLVYRTLKSLPPEPVRKLKNLTLYCSDDGRRGLGGGTTIILRCQNVTDEELVGVLVHEMGHIADTGVLNGTAAEGESGYMDGGNVIYKDDPSVKFYNLSFNTDGKIKEDATEYDFVSGYAKSDPFEDFAESYAYYILHGSEFRVLMQTNVILTTKYNFLKTEVFNGKEYFNGDDKEADAQERSYDVTVLPYSMKKFFVI
jgi:hypothetical protein